MGIRAWLSKKFGAGSKEETPPPEQTSATTISAKKNPMAAGLRSFTGGQALLGYLEGSTDRLSRYQDYAALERRHPMVARAYDMFADYAIFGGEARDSGSFKVELPDEETQGIVDEVFHRLGMQDASWPIVRAMCQFGDHFEELVVAPSLGLFRLKTPPRNQMYRLHDEWGQHLGFVQLPSVGGAERIDLKPWQIVHWRLTVDREERYGRSVAYSAVRAGRELGLVEDSSTMARLKRGTQRLKWLVEVPALASQEEIDEILARYQARNDHHVYMDSDGRLVGMANPMRATEDIYLPTYKDSKADVATLPGDRGVGSIADVAHKQARLFMAFPWPLSWYGQTGARTRADADQSALNAIRAVRRVRKAYSEGLEQIVRVALVTRGISVERAREMEPVVTYPAISHADTLLRLQIDKLRLQVASLHRSLRLLSRRDVLVRVLEIPEGEVDELLQRADEDPATVGPSAAASTESLEGDEASRAVEQLRDAMEASPMLGEMLEIVRELAEAGLRRVA